MSTESSGPVPEQKAAPDNTRRTYAHVVPFVVFMVFLLAPGLFDEPDGEDAPWYLAHPTQWTYPLQCLACLGVLLFYRREYEFTWPRGAALAIGAGILGIGFWLLPGLIYQWLNLNPGWWTYLGLDARMEGFDPAAAATRGSGGWIASVGFRFLRMVIVVPLIEEIFWRGFLMRLLTDPDGDYWQVPFGTHHVRALWGVTAVFVLVHAPVDYPGALIYGLLTYVVTVRTKSLSACILMHAVANLLLGLYVMQTEQWGYW